MSVLRERFLQLVVRPRSRRYLLEGGVLFVCFIAILFGASRYFSEYYGKSLWVSPSWFAPSVMVASGRGLVNPEEGKVPGLKEFLAQKTDAFDLNAIPAGLNTLPLDNFQRIHPYLIYAVGMVWSLFGVSWSALAWLHGVLFAFSALAVYGVFRLAMNRFLAGAATMAYIFFPCNLAFLPYLREYAKTPFILGTLCLLGWLIVRPVRKGVLLAISAFLGVLLGAGLGFRFDLILFVFVTAGVLLFFLPGRFRDGFRWNCGALGVFLLCFLPPAWPILKSIVEIEDMEPLHIVEGFATEFTECLDLGGVHYEYLSQYNDAYTFATIATYGHHVLGYEAEDCFCNRECTEASRMYLLEVARHFPADMLLRAFASLAHVVRNSPCEMAYSTTAVNPPMDAAMTWLTPLMAHLHRFGLVYAVAGIMAIAFANLRLAIAALLFFLFLGGYPSLQFSQRHYFHLSFLGLWFFGFAWCLLGRGMAAGYRAARLRRFPRTVAQAREWFSPWRPHAIRAAAFTAVSCLLLTAPVLAATSYQTAHLKTLFNDYTHADWEPLPTHAEESSEMPGWVLYRPDAWVDYQHLPEAQQSWQTHAAYLMLEFDVKAPDTLFVSKFNAPNSFNNFTQTKKISALPGKEQSVRYLLPVFESPEKGAWGSRAFEGILLQKDDPTKLKNMYVLRDLGKTPLLLDAMLRENWENEPLTLQFQRNALPLCLRANYAYRDNLLQGGCKEWLSGKAPVLAAPPKANSLLRLFETTGVLEQIWSQPDNLANAASLFSISVSRLKPNTGYEFYVRAFNPSGAPVQIALCQATASDTQPYLTPRFITVAPSPFFREFGGQFTTADRGECTVYFLTYLDSTRGEAAFPASVQWKDWRLVESNVSAGGAS